MNRLGQLLTFDDALAKWSPDLCKKNYGAFMIESSLADWVELLALLRVSVPMSSVIDALKDSGLDEEYHSERLELGEMEPSSINTFPALRERLDIRQRYLGNAYPFHFDQFDRLQYDSVTDANNPYLLMLLISLLKGHVFSRDKTVLDPLTKAFEFLTCTCLRNGGLKCEVVGTGNGNGKFEEKLASAAKSLGLAAYPVAASRSARANDERVDVVGGNLWHDGRKGNVLVLIQCACGDTSSWVNKAHTIPAENWRNYFGEVSYPYCALAVPYDITDRAISAIIDGYNDNCTFFDRLRLVKNAGRSALPEGPAGQHYVREVIRLAIYHFGIDI